MTTQLYKLIDQLQFLESIEPEDDEQNERIKETLAMTKVNIEEKVINIAKYILTCKAEAEVYKTEIDRLQKKRNAIVNRYEWLKSYLLTEMRKAFIGEVKADTFKVSIQINPPSVVELDITQVPKEFIRIKFELDKTQVLNAWKINKEKVPGTDIVTDKESLRIR